MLRALIHLFDRTRDLRDAQALIGDTVLDLTQSDTACVPGWTTLKLQNSSSKAPAFIAMADESPVHRKLGIFEQR